MNEQQAIAKAARLNATRYKKSRISVKPMKYGNTWILVGCGKEHGANPNATAPAK